MLSLPARKGQAVRPPRHWKNVSAAEAAMVIPAGATVAAGWLGDDLALALETGFLRHRMPRDLTIVYGVTAGNGRTHGLNRLAHAGLVRRVIGGQWHPVPGLQALARDEQIEAYSLPAGLIGRLFRDIAAGLTLHLSRSGLGTFTDPRQGGGRLNGVTRTDLVHLVRASGQEALMVRSFPIDVALIPVAFMEGSAAIAMTRDAMTIARAARASSGLVIAQMDRVGTLDRLPPGQVVVPDTLVDLMVDSDGPDRLPEMFATPPHSRARVKRLPH
jgi:propionate CoA-transferase